MTLQVGTLRGYEGDVRDYAHIVFSKRAAGMIFMIGVALTSRNVYEKTVSSADRYIILRMGNQISSLNRWTVLLRTLPGVQALGKPDASGTLTGLG